MSSVAAAAETPLVFITGASSGIGLALAAQYLARGWRVALAARRLEALEAWRAEQGEAAQRCCAFEADVRDVESMLRAAQACVAQVGWPEVVIANAGIGAGMDTAVRADLALMRDVLETNTLGLAATFHPFLAHFRARQRGTLVVIASVAAIRGLPGHGAYCASKAAAVAYAESLRGECRRHGVRVITLLPGYVATPLTARNPYRMPFLLAPDEFARQAYLAIAAGRSYRVIPWQMAWLARLIRCLPNAVWDRALAKRPRKRRLKDET